MGKITRIKKYIPLYGTYLILSFELLSTIFAWEVPDVKMAVERMK